MEGLVQIGKQQCNNHHEWDPEVLTEGATLHQSDLYGCWIQVKPPTATSLPPALQAPLNHEQTHDSTSLPKGTWTTPWPWKANLFRLIDSITWWWQHHSMGLFYSHGIYCTFNKDGCTVRKTLQSWAVMLHIQPDWACVVTSSCYHLCVYDFSLRV